MDTEHICHACGKPLPPNAPKGLCPECLMKAGFGSGVAPEPGQPSRTPAFVPPAVEEVARLFPQFEVLELLGQGGMGAVYKARQPALDRMVALKILPPQTGADSGFADRFTREARALARLNHPNIVGVYEFGQAGGLHYFVMEYVEGLNLRQLEQAGRLSPREALKIIPQICDALQFAHDEGIVHRDIKPENVMLDRKGRVKITDFGLAKILGREPEGMRLTGAKDVMGTPHYMAPEQIEHPQEVDHRADIYSLGVVFYEMLTGELPLGKFQSPSKKVQVDVRLDEVVLHALEKEPERRYQQASQVKTDVETIAATYFGRSRPEEAQTGTPEVRGQKEGEDRTLSTGTPTALAAGAWAAVERARRLVKWPAIGLITTSLLGPFMLGVLVTTGRLKAGGWMLYPLILNIALIVVAALGGFKLLHLESRRMAVAGGIAGCVMSFFNLLCLPFAVWVLAVSSRRDVQDAFGKGHLAPPPDSPQAKRHGGRPVAAGSAANDRPPSNWVSHFFAGRSWYVGIIMGLALVGGLIVWGMWERRSTLSDETVVRVEMKLRQEIENRLGEAGWKLEGLSVSVSPDLRRAECRFGPAYKGGLTWTPFNATIGIEPQGQALWLVAGQGEFQFLRFSVDTSAEMAVGQALRTGRVTTYDGKNAFAVQQKLLREVVDRLKAASYRWDQLTLAIHYFVNPDVAECTIEGLRKSKGAAVHKETPVELLDVLSGGLDIRHTGNGLWTVRGTGGLTNVSFTVDTTAEMGPPQKFVTSLLKPFQYAEPEEPDAATSLVQDRTQSQPTARSRYPKAAHIGRNNSSVMLHHDDVDLHYALFYAGDFSSSSRGAHNTRSKAWTDDGSLKLKGGRTFGYLRGATDPDHLHINGQEYDLRQGRVFTLHDDGAVAQEALFPALAVARDPEQLAGLIATTREPIQASAKALSLESLSEADRARAVALFNDIEDFGHEFEAAFATKNLAAAQTGTRRLLTRLTNFNAAVKGTDYEFPPGIFDDIVKVRQALDEGDWDKVQKAARHNDAYAREFKRIAERMVELARQQQPGAGSAFGPVIERVLAGKGDTNKQFIDFDTGRQFASAEFFGPKAEPSPDETQKWLRQTGIDAVCDTRAHYGGLVCFEMVAAPVPSKEWDHLPPSRLDHYLIASAPGTPVIMSGRGELPATFAVKTREGARGLLQILGLTNEPPGVKIHYKLVETVAPRSTPSSPEKAPRGTALGS